MSRSLFFVLAVCSALAVCYCVPGRIHLLPHLETIIHPKVRKLKNPSRSGSIIPTDSTFKEIRFSMRPGDKMKKDVKAQVDMWPREWCLRPTNQHNFDPLIKFPMFPCKWSDSKRFTWRPRDVKVEVDEWPKEWCLSPDMNQHNMDPLIKFPMFPCEWSDSQSYTWQPRDVKAQVNELPKEWCLRPDMNRHNLDPLIKFPMFPCKWSDSQSFTWEPSGNYY